MKKDSYSTGFPVRIRYRTSELADSAKLTGFQKQIEAGFKHIERAIGDIHNTENATNSVLSDQPLYINSLGRAVGSMANLVPPLSGVTQYSPKLASKLADATYNVIPHPDQSIKCEIGCKFDGLATPFATERTCLKNQTAYYLQVQGSNTGVCQNTSCPDWSGRSGRTINREICDVNVTSNAYREYKVVLPRELRLVDTYSVKYYSNCGGSIYDRFRIDNGEISFGDDKTDPSKTWAVATNTAISGVSSQVKYIYPNLDSTADYIVVIEVPAKDVGQSIQINNIGFGQINSTSQEPSRYLFDLSAVNTGTNISITVFPSSSADGAQAAISQVWIIEKASKAHQNYNIQLLLPKVLDTLSAGTEIPPNFLQLFDTNTLANRIIDKARYFATTFNPLSSSNKYSNRDAFDVTIYDDQALDVGNSRYLSVTVGTDLATAVGALLEAFVEHVTDPEIHMTEEQVCQLLANKTYCCTDKFIASVSRLSPSNKKGAAAPGAYNIWAHIYGGFPPYTVIVDWGDGITDSLNSIVSGVQTFTLNEDASPDNGQEFLFSHVYNARGTYNLTFDVQDNVDIFGCEASLTDQVSPFNIGSVPNIDLEARLDSISSYPNYLFTDIETGYSFDLTAASSWDTNPTYHVLTQVHSTDDESGKPSTFAWIFDNPNSLTYQFYYENVTKVSNEAVASLVAYSGTLTNDYIQQDSLVLMNTSGRVYTQGVDFNVNHQTGAINAIIGGSISATASTLRATYFHYAYATTLPSVSGASQWVVAGDPVSSSSINMNTLTARTDLNTIRFKVKE